jgi:hypothetical protein
MTLHFITSIEKQIVEIVIASLPLILCVEQTISLLNLKMIGTSHEHVI